MSQLMRIGGIGAFIAVGLTVSAVDKQMNYVEVEAEVLSIDASCYLEKEEGNKRRFTDPMDCKLAEALLASHPAYKGFKNIRES